MIDTRQRARLRAQANTLSSSLTVGKAGLTEQVVQQALDNLNTREIVKGTVLESCPDDARTVMHALCARIGAEPVQTIGRRFVLYRPFVQQ